MIAEFAFEDELLETQNDYFNIKRIYDNSNKELSIIQILDNRNRICKCLFYENGKRLSNMSVYNPATGKEIKNITYRADGKTICSIREYNILTEKLLNVIFFKADGKSPSSIIEYNDEGNETQFTIFDENGIPTTQCL